MRKLSSTQTKTRLAWRHEHKPGVPVPPTHQLRRLFTWAESKGVLWPKVRYPVRFDPGYWGVQATGTIAPMETIIDVPRSLVITADRADNCELKKIIDANPKLFARNSHEWADDYRLILFLLFEEAKGARSDWHAYIQCLPRTPDLLCYWPAPLLSSLQDPSLVTESQHFLASLYDHWKSFHAAVLQHPSLFDPDTLTFSKFQWAYFILSTRAFGDGLQYTALCPIAEFVNHSNSQTHYKFGVQKFEKWNCEYEEDEDEWPKELFSPSLNNIATFLKGVHQLPQKSQSYLTLTAWEECGQKETPKNETKLVKSPKEGLKIVAGVGEHYLPGSEVVLNYGARSNRTLLTEYGFALANDTLAYELVHVKIEEVMRSGKNKAVWTFKVRKNVLCAPLLSAIRALLWDPSVHSLESALSPGDPQFDQQVTTACVTLLEKHIAAFPTTIEEDEKLLASATDVRLYFAIQYRRQRKEAIRGQLALLKGMIA